MHSQASEPEQIKSHKKSPQGRGNFSKCGKLCDQTFYLQGGSLNSLNTKVQVSIPVKKQPKKSTTAFSSVSRQIKQNLRFSIPLPVGEFSHHPNHQYGRSKSPTWSFPMKQRYQNEKIKQYEICRKHPIALKQQSKVFNTTNSIKQALKGNVSLMKSTSMHQTMDQTRNYSIVLPRKTSAVQFFSKTKIKHPFYLSKVEIMNEQQKLQKNPQIQPCPKGYIQFYKKRARQPNRNVKGFETFLQSYYDQKQYNNFSLTQYPITPNYHIDFDKHLDRDTDPKQTKGPNLQLLNIDPVRILHKNIDLNTSKFRQKIKTRYDRIQPEPNTRIDYDSPAKSLGGMVTIDKVIARNKQLFPIVDPAIKKAGDKQAKQILKKNIPIKQINEAMRPRCNQKIKI